MRKKVYTMFANNHHNDGHVAVWIPAAPGLQEMLVKGEPKKFFKPPYVGVYVAGSASNSTKWTTMISHTTFRKRGG